MNKYENALKQTKASALETVRKLNQLARELRIPDTNHTWSKARMNAQDVVDFCDACLTPSHEP